MHDRNRKIAACAIRAVKSSLEILQMKTEASKSVIQQAGQAIYEADPTLKPFDDLPEEEKTGYYCRPKQRSNVSWSRWGKIVNESC